MAWAEAHWQGIEVVPLTPGVARMLKIPIDTPGVLIDEAEQPGANLGGGLPVQLMASHEEIHI